MHRDEHRKAMQNILRCGNLLEVRQGGIRCPTPSAPPILTARRGTLGSVRTLPRAIEGGCPASSPSPDPPARPLIEGGCAASPDKTKANTTNPLSKQWCGLPTEVLQALAFLLRFLTTFTCFAAVGKSITFAAGGSSDPSPVLMRCFLSA